MKTYPWVVMRNGKPFAIILSDSVRACELFDEMKYNDKRCDWSVHKIKKFIQ